MQLFYDERYVAAKDDFDTTRKSGAIMQSLLRKPIKGIDIVSPRAATIHELCFVHDEHYVKAVQAGEEPLASSAGFKWDPGLWEMVSASTGGVVAAAFAALENGVSGSLSSGLHHARREHGEGFCTFNGLALAAKMAAAINNQVLIIDLDAHCGGGTHSIIKNDNKIQQLDVSVCSFDNYNEYSDRHNLHIVRDPNLYLSTIERSLKWFEQWSFDLVIYNAGMDPHSQCTMGGLRGITKNVLQRREKMIFQWCKRHNLPVAFVLAGGYTNDQLTEERLVDLHRLTLTAAAKIQ